MRDMGTSSGTQRTDHPAGIASSSLVNPSLSKRLERASLLVLLSLAVLFSFAC